MLKEWKNGERAIETIGDVKIEVEVVGRMPGVAEHWVVKHKIEDVSKYDWVDYLGYVGGNCLSAKKPERYYTVRALVDIQTRANAEEQAEQLTKALIKDAFPFHRIIDATASRG
jgi:hypothetical protein